MDIRQTAQQRLDALLARLQPAVRQAFLDMIAKKAATINLTDLADALEWAERTGDPGRVLAMLQMNQALTFPLEEAVRAVVLAGGNGIASQLPLAIRGNYGFGGNARAVQVVQKITGELVTNLAASDREMLIGLLRRDVTQAVDTGIPARRLAYEIVGRKNAAGIREGGYLGLDVPRAEQAQRVSAMLRDPALIRDYFIGGKIVDGKFVGGTPRYTTTDRRYDKRVRDAIASGKALTQADADTIANLHRAKLLKNRGDTIAFNESINALRAGEHAGWQSAVDNGTIAESRITRTWLATQDSHTRHDHRLMQGQKVLGLHQPFVFPDGTMAMFPGDSAMGAAAADLINCRCQSLTRLTRPGQ